MAERSRKSIKVVLSEDLYNKVEKLSESIGMSRSGYVAFVLGQYVYQQDKVNDVLMDTLKSGILDVVINESKKKDK